MNHEVQSFTGDILNYLHDQVAVIGKDLKFLYLNQSFESFLSLNIVETEGIHDLSIESVFPENLSDIIQGVKECFQSGVIIN